MQRSVPCRWQWGRWFDTYLPSYPVSQEPPFRLVLLVGATSWGLLRWDGGCAAATPLEGCWSVSCSYCSQVLSREVDACVTDLLKELVRFQDRMYQKDPVKARAKRRLVLGLREVLKHLKLRRLKCVIISPNCERIQSKGEGASAPRGQCARFLLTQHLVSGVHLPTTCLALGSQSSSWQGSRWPRGPLAAGQGTPPSCSTPGWRRFARAGEVG